MIDCLHNVNGVCEFFSDETVKQPCIESPCPYYEDITEITSICPLCKLNNSLGCPYDYTPNKRDCDKFISKRGNYDS